MVAGGNPTPLNASYCRRPAAGVGLCSIETHPAPNPTVAARLSYPLAMRASVNGWERGGASRDIYSRIAGPGTLFPTAADTRRHLPGNGVIHAASAPLAGGLLFRSPVVAAGDSGPAPLGSASPSVERRGFLPSRAIAPLGAFFFLRSVKFSDQLSRNIADTHPGVSHD